MKVSRLLLQTMMHTSNLACRAADARCLVIGGNRNRSDWRKMNAQTELVTNAQGAAELGGLSLFPWTTWILWPEHARSLRDWRLLPSRAATCWASARAAGRCDCDAGLVLPGVSLSDGLFFVMLYFL
jgi:hypothetical protein